MASWHSTFVRSFHWFPLLLHEDPTVRDKKAARFVCARHSFSSRRYDLLHSLLGNFWLLLQFLNPSPAWQTFNYVTDSIHWVEEQMVPVLHHLRTTPSRNNSLWKQQQKCNTCNKYCVCDKLTNVYPMFEIVSPDWSMFMSTSVEMIKSI